MDSFNLKSDGSLPARLTAAQVAQVLGFQEHEVPILVATKHLAPLGKPVPNAIKYFARCEIQELAQDANWLKKATQSVYNYWRDKNERKSSRETVPFQEAVPNESETMAA
jgi:hypothetical protein